ncbi:MAG: peptidylprolyl isomerase [Planctomycetes bacterium]|nr:peptidylprolyl isomerase [Planctomycetota bacterium]
MAVIETSKGRIVFRFRPEVAPKTVENFTKLAGKGFYDWLAFHRVIPGFMIQGGCPKGDGTGGPGYSIKAEFSEERHLKGTVSMARASDPDSAGCQFFICLEAQPHLDRKYTVFGQVVEGQQVVDEIGALDTDAGDRPLERVVMRSVRIEERPR